MDRLVGEVDDGGVCVVVEWLLSSTRFVIAFVRWRREGMEIDGLTVSGFDLVSVLDDLIGISFLSNRHCLRARCFFPLIWSYRVNI